jgi:hypothetical protein
VKEAECDRNITYILQYENGKMRHVEAGGTMAKVNQASAVQYWTPCILNISGFPQ